MSIVDVDVTQEQVIAAEVTIYTASVASNFHSAKITGGQCTNSGTTASELTVNIVQSGGSTATTNQYLTANQIRPGETNLLNPIVGSGLTLKSGDFIVTKGSVAAMLNLKLSIVEKYTDS